MYIVLYDGEIPGKIHLRTMNDIIFDLFICDFLICENEGVFLPYLY